MSALSIWAQSLFAMSNSLMLLRTCALVRPIAFALSSTYLSIASPRVTSRRRVSPMGRFSRATGLARSFSRFSIQAAAVERSSKVRFSRQTVFPARRTAIWASQEAVPSLRFRLMMVPMGLQHLAQVTTFVVNPTQNGCDLQQMRQEWARGLGDKWLMWIKNIAFSTHRAYRLPP